jgi:SPP1 gp7 family putative phage head morphogenesis protein
MERLEQRPFNASRAKAALIARDQIRKFNGDLSRVRQQHAGIESYSWDTAHDERVRGNPRGIYPNARPSHWAQQGKVYSWSSSGAPGLGHPGEPIQCRCLPKPVFDEPEDEE